MNQNTHNGLGILTDEVVGGIRKEFVIVGKGRVHAWYAWAIVGIVFGMALGIVYVANRTANFSSSSAAIAPAPVLTTLTFGSDGDETFLIDKKKGKDVTGDVVKINRYETWSKAIPGTWWISFRPKTNQIWKGPVNGKVVSFLETVNIDGAPEGGEISVMVDDNVRILVNNIEVFKNTGKAAIIKVPRVVAIPKSALKSGDNTFEFEVRQNDVADNLPYGLDYEVAITYVSADTLRQEAADRNTARVNDLQKIMDAIKKNAADNKGVFTCSSGSIPSSSTLMASTGGYNIGPCLVSKYLTSMPFDPNVSDSFWKSVTSYNTGYFISKASDGKITIHAKYAELGQIIQLGFIPPPPPLPSLPKGSSVTCPAITASSSMTVFVDSGTPPAHYALMGTTGDSVLRLRLISNSTQAHDISSLTFSDTIFNNASKTPSFENLRLYVGAQTAAGPVAMTMVDSANGTVTFNFASSPIRVAANSSVTVTLTGDVATFASGNAHSGSNHNFCFKSLSGVGSISGSAITPYVPSATSNPVTVLRSKLIISAKAGNSSRNRVVNDKISALTFSAPAAGSVTLNTITLTFTGTAIANPNASGTKTVAFDVALRKQDGAYFGNAQPQTCTPSASKNSCQVTFTPDYTISAGTNSVVDVNINSSSFLNDPNSAEFLDVSINANTDVDYGDGTFAKIPLESTFAPVVVFQGTYQ